jgi:hypothetical protein
MPSKKMMELSFIQRSPLDIPPPYSEQPPEKIAHNPFLSMRRFLVPKAPMSGGKLVL